MVFIKYVGLGFDHVIPLGFDHLLFMVSLFLLNSKLKTAIIQCSIFTLAHSITLALVAMGIFQFNPAVIEVIIALSIFVVALENVFLPELKIWRLVLIFAFGLVHGMGFANALAEIGLPQNDFLISLVGFNVGVELAQLVVIAACYFLVTKWISKNIWYQDKFVKPVSLGIACIALFWAIERFLSA